MKKILLFVILSLLYTGCEKNPEDDYILKFYGDAYEDIGYSVSIAPDGYIITGQFNEIKKESGTVISEFSDKNMAIIKTDLGGNVTWKVSSGGKYTDWGRKVCQLGNGSIICVGTYTDSISATLMETDIFVLKVSSSGEIEWRKIYKESGNQTGIDILQTTDGFIVLGSNDVERPPQAGVAGNNPGRKDIYFLSISGAGELLGSRPYGFPNDDMGVTIKNDIGGNYIILGTTDLSENAGMDKNNLILIKINSLLDILDQRILGDVTDEYAADMEVQETGYLISGTIGKETDSQEAFVRIVKKNIQSAPDPPLKFKINGASTSVKAMTQYGTGQYLLSGQSGSGSAGDMLVFITDASGNPVEGKFKISGSTGLQVANDVVSGDDGYVIAVGKNTYDYNSMITLLKFRF
jgi:hypothetical protein